MNKTGQVVRWDSARGFGFIRSAQTDVDVFFHIRDYGGQGAPQEGMRVQFEEIHVGGRGPRAMAVRAADKPAAPRTPRAVSAVQDRRRRPPVSKLARQPGDHWLVPVLVAGVLWCGLIAWAAHAGRLPAWSIWGWLLLNVWTFLAYWRDKWAARKGQWRTPENTLHLWSLLGGWPAARLAQQLLRHKSSKASFQSGYWASSAAHMLALGAWLYLGPERLLALA
jgi:uncharacterized membrane protein YsdA (DUF1294 family)/cold shock CspA family protein